MDNNTKPFLWNFVKLVEKSMTATGGEEITKSANEEASHAIIEFE